MPDSARDWFYRKFFPEVFIFPDVKQGKRALWDNWHNAYGILWVFGIMMMAMLFILLMQDVLGDMGSAIVQYASILSGVFVALFVFRSNIKRDLRKRLIGMGIPICLRCLYDLRGQTVPRCPECGRPFDDRLLKEQE